MLENKSRDCQVSGRNLFAKTALMASLTVSASAADIVEQKHKENKDTRGNERVLESDGKFNEFVATLERNGVSFTSEQKSVVLAEYKKLASSNPNAGGVSDYVNKKYEQISGPIGSHDWWAGILGIIAIAFYLYVIPKYGYGKIIHQITVDKIPTKTTSFVVFATGSAVAAASSYVDDAYVPMACVGLLSAYGYATAMLNERCKRNVEAGDADKTMFAAYEESQKTSPAALWSVDGKVMAWSKKMEDLLGYTEAEMTGDEDPIGKLYGYDEDQVAIIKKNLFLAFDAKEPYVKIFRPMGKDGKIRELLFHTIPMIGQDQRSKGRLSIVIPREPFEMRASKK